MAQLLTLPVLEINPSFFSFKKNNLDSLFPTKNYPWIKYHIPQFLLNPKHNGVVGIILSQSRN